jgi:hypothetical protein
VRTGSSRAPLQVSVGKTLMGLDSSNCSRSQVPVAVPLDVAVPAK